MDVTNQSTMETDIVSALVSTFSNVNMTSYLANVSVHPTPVTEEHLSSSSSSEEVISYIYMAIGSLGMLDNLFVLVVILNVASMRTKLTNIFIINQSFIDFGVSFFLVAGSTVRGGHVPYTGVAGEIYCRVWSTKLFLWGFLVSSTYNLVALTLERYFEVVHPIWHKVTFTKTKAYVTLVCVWLAGPLFNALYMIPTTSLKANGQCALYSEWTDALSHQMFGVFTVVLQYFLPLGILIYSYSRMAHRLTKQSTRVGDNNGMTSTGRGLHKEDRYQKAKRNTIKTLAIVAFSFIVCWSWNQIYYTMMNLGYPSDYVSPFYHFTVIAVFMNCCINPFIYAIQYEQFKVAARKMFCKCLVRRSQTGLNDTNATLTTAGGRAVGPSEP